MLEALTASGVKSPNAQSIDRVVEQVRSETRRKKMEPPMAVWKDPFADDPERPIPVRPAARSSARARWLGVLRRNQARVNADNAVAEAEEAERRAAAAVEQANRARAVAAEARAVAVAARARAEAAQREARLAEELVRPRPPARRKLLTRTDQRVRPAHGQAVDASFAQVTRRNIATRPRSRGFDAAAREAQQPPPVAPPAAPPPPIYPAPAKDHTSGILVVPITH